MGDILLKMTQPFTKTYRIKNLGSLDIAQDLPAMIYALPESTDDDAIGGTSYVYQFQLLDNNGSPFYTKNGIITKVNISKSGDAPVTYNATVVFSVATMTAGS